MQIIHSVESFEAPWAEGTLTLGVFDGIHRGHARLLKRLQQTGTKKGQARIIVTYLPHPDLVLGKKGGEPKELFTYEEKLSLLQGYDLDAAVFLAFTREFAQMTALHYLHDILTQKLRAKHIIIGYDQCFGRDRKGDFSFLKKYEKQYGYRVERIRAVRHFGQKISSTWIRQEIEAGNIHRANRLLGHAFYITGTVVRGYRRGTTIGFPTVNLEVAESKLIPKEGVYIGYAEWGSDRYRAMINIGNNPTFHVKGLSIEAHLLDFHANVYGETMRLFFDRRIRDERKFSSVDALRTQLEKDRTIAAKLPL